MKRWMIRTAALLAAVSLMPMQACALSAQKAILIDGTTGRVLLEKDADSRSLIASTTKIMTALVICEQCNVLDRMRIPKEAVGIEGSSMYLREGEVLSIQELLYGLMLSSGNDAAIALAIYCAGTVEGFAEMMNDKARALCMTGSHFENPNGLDSPGHYSTARDLAKLSAYAMQNPVFSKTVSTKTVKVGERCLRNHNKLLWLVEGADGIKTGFTKAAGRILVSSALRDDRRLIAVTINAPNDWNDHKEMLETGFSGFQPRKIITSGQELGALDVLGGAKGHAAVAAAEDFLLALRKDERPQIVIPGKRFVYAPVVQGTNAGFAYILLDGKAVGKMPIVFTETVEQFSQPEKTIWEKIFGRNRQ